MITTDMKIAIITLAKEKSKKLDILLLKQLAPLVASSYNNTKELLAFITTQDKIRNIGYKDYYTDIELGEENGKTV